MARKRGDWLDPGMPYNTELYEDNAGGLFLVVKPASGPMAKKNYVYFRLDSTDIFEEQGGLPAIVMPYNLDPLEIEISKKGGIAVVEHPTTKIIAKFEYTKHGTVVTLSPDMMGYNGLYFFGLRG